MVATVPGWLRRADVGASHGGLAAVARVHPHARAHRGLRAADGREGAAVGGASLQVAELALQVRLEPAAVLPLEGTKVVHAPLQLFTLLHQGAHGLPVPFLGVALQALGPGPGIAGDLLGLAARLAEDLVRLAAGPAQRLVRLAPSIGDRLIGRL